MAATIIKSVGIRQNIIWGDLMSKTAESIVAATGETPICSFMIDKVYKTEKGAAAAIARSVGIFDDGLPATVVIGETPRGFIACYVGLAA